MTTWVLYNTLVAGGLGAVVALLCRVNSSRPALCHLLWLVVLVALVAPPVPTDQLPGAVLRDGLDAWLALPAAEERGLAATPGAAPWPVSTAPAARDVTDWPVAGEALESGASAPPGSSRSRLADVSLTAWLLALWAAGSLVMLVRHAVRILAFDRQVATADAAPAALERAVGRVADRLDMAPPPVRVFSGVGSPSVWCFGRPRLLWPVATAERGAGDPALIAHELAHIARRDHWVARLIALAEVLLWWHPLFWFVRRRVHDYSELSCDAWALWAYPADRRAYAEALIEAQERTVTAPLALQGLCATGRDVKDFRRRLTMIMSRHVSPRVSRLAASLAVVATLAVLPGFDEETEPQRIAGSGAEGAQPDWAAGIAHTIDVHVLGAEAEALFQDGDHEQAYEVFSRVVAMDPSNGPARARLGYLAIGAGAYEEALEHLGAQLAAGHRPEVAAYNKACAFALSGQVESAQKALAKAVALGFENAELLASDADLEAVRGTTGYEHAVQSLARVSEIRGKLGGIGGWLMTDEKELALKQELGDIVTGDAEFQHQLGLALLSAGRAHDAAVAFQRQADGGYSVANAHYNLACAQAVSGRAEAALAALAQAAEQGMAYAAVHEDGDLASLRGDPRFEELAQRIAGGEQVKKQLKQALSAGDAATAAAIVDDMGHAGEAFADARAWASLELAQVLLDQGRADEATSYLHLAADHGHELHDVSFHLSRAHAMLGQDKTAMRHLDDALTLGFADGEAVAELLHAHPVGSEEDRYELLLRAQAASQEAEWKAKKKAEKKAQAHYGESDV